MRIFIPKPLFLYPKISLSFPTEFTKKWRKAQTLKQLVTPTFCVKHSFSHVICITCEPQLSDNISKSDKMLLMELLMVVEIEALFSSSLKVVECVFVKARKDFSNKKKYLNDFHISLDSDLLLDCSLKLFQWSKVSSSSPRGISTFQLVCDKLFFFSARLI